MAAVEHPDSHVEMCSVPSFRISNISQRQPDRILGLVVLFSHYPRKILNAFSVTCKLETETFCGLELHLRVFTETYKLPH